MANSVKDLKHSLPKRRAKQIWTRKEMLGRVLWGVASLLFRYSPKPFWAWRRVMLRFFGASIGSEVNIDPTCEIFIPWHLQIGSGSTIGRKVVLYALGNIEIGEQVVVSQHVHLCAGSHDFENPEFPLIKSCIRVGDCSWICADSFIGPNVKIGEAAVVGARSVVVKDVGDWQIVAGNPARYVKTRDLVMNHARN